ncbi:hypothetical protein QNZ73_004590 [Vibrio parahaemolyticus]|nr:hypothetical protein [Vibrio parahaemolyticus]ELB2100181.1 hypothetical protein [Vibrio parahaemolyticus]ELB2209907.1 hypothetical protein [Vibrio parahaemolyticus]ELB2291680.1 hypothetical protein [Vibrio parahaemolyticus]
MGKNTPTDVAALAGAATAAGVSVFVSSGAFGILSIGIGLTLMILVVTYASESAKNSSQRFAFSSVFGLLCVLIAAPIYELIGVFNRSLDKSKSLLAYVGEMDVLKCGYVMSSSLFITWLICSATTFAMVSLIFRNTQNSTS